jgi:hypothetical protein
MKPFAEAGKIARYLSGKRSELEDLDLKDVVMAKAILDIHRKRSRKERVNLPLFALRQIHTLDRENAIQATRQRVEALQRHRRELLRQGTLSCDTLARYLPSVSWIKVVQESADSFLAFEGNGRIAALQTVFTAADGLRVEVERYEFRNPNKIIRRLNRVRRLNGLLPDDRA